MPPIDDMTDIELRNAILLTASVVMEKNMPTLIKRIKFLAPRYNTQTGLQPRDRYADWLDEVLYSALNRATRNAMYDGTDHLDDDGKENLAP